MRDDKQNKFQASDVNAIVFNAEVLRDRYDGYTKHAFKDSSGTQRTVATLVIRNTAARENDTEVVVHSTVDAYAAKQFISEQGRLHYFEENLNAVKNAATKQQPAQSAPPIQTQPQRTEDNSQSDSGFSEISAPNIGTTAKQTTAPNATEKSVLDTPAKHRTIHIIPEVAFGYTNISRHIRLVVVTQELGMTFQDAYEKRQVFDPRDFGLGAQSTLDDTNCGRYVAAMTIQAAGLAKDGLPITPEHLKASPAVQRALHFNSTDDAKAGLQNAYVKPLPKNLKPQELLTYNQAIIDHNLAKIRCLKAEYEARIKAERKYHGSGVAGYSTATLLTSKIAAFFGKAYSATDKLAAANAILKNVDHTLSGQQHVNEEWMKNIDPKVFGAARQGELGKCVSAIAQAQIILRQYHPNQSHQPRSR